MSKRSHTKFIVVHCSATPVTSDIGVDEIRDWHQGKGWSDIGYHAVVRRNGQIEYGRHLDEAGAHVKGKNYQSVGVCLVGGVDPAGKAEANYTPDQFISLKALLITLKRSYPQAIILGHRDLSPDLNGDGKISSDEWMKECPCFDVPKWIKGWKK